MSQQQQQTCTMRHSFCYGHVVLDSLYPSFMERPRGQTTPALYDGTADSLVTSAYYWVVGRANRVRRATLGRSRLVRWAACRWQRLASRAALACYWAAQSALELAPRLFAAKKPAVSGGLLVRGVAKSPWLHRVSRALWSPVRFEIIDDEPECKVGFYASDPDIAAIHAEHQSTARERGALRRNMTWACEERPERFNTYVEALLEAAGAASVETDPNLALMVVRDDFRRIRNEEQVVAAWETAGFRVLRVAFEDMPWDEQLRLVRRARVMLCPYGSCMVNALFMRPESADLVVYWPDLMGPTFWTSKYCVLHTAMMARGIRTHQACGRLRSHDDDPDLAEVVKFFRSREGERMSAESAAEAWRLNLDPVTKPWAGQYPFVVLKHCTVEPETLAWSVRVVLDDCQK